MTDIKCKAKNCIHHTQNDKCAAPCICVKCESANCSAETECETFIAK